MTEVAGPDPRALRHVAVVRYDAFGDMGGRLSFSAALLDDQGDGLVLSSINGRSETRTYAKALVGGRASTCSHRRSRTRSGPPSGPESGVLPARTGDSYPDVSPGGGTGRDEPDDEGADQEQQHPRQPDRDCEHGAGVRQLPDRGDHGVGPCVSPVVVCAGAVPSTRTVWSTVTGTPSVPITR